VFLRPSHEFLSSLGITAAGRGLKFPQWISGSQTLMKSLNKRVGKLFFIESSYEGREADSSVKSFSSPCPIFLRNEG